MPSDDGAGVDKSAVVDESSEASGAAAGVTSDCSVPGVPVDDDCGDTASSDSVGGTSAFWSVSPDGSSSPDVSAPPELRTTTPGLGSLDLSLDLSLDRAGSESDAFSSDPDPCSTDPSPVDGVDPSDDTIPESVFESGPPRAGLSTLETSEEGSDVGSAAATPVWAIAAEKMTKTAASAPTPAMRLESPTDRAPCRCPF